MVTICVFVSNWQELNLKTDAPHIYCKFRLVLYVRMFLVIAFSNIP